MTAGQPLDLLRRRSRNAVLSSAMGWGSVLVVLVVLQPVPAGAQQVLLFGAASFAALHAACVRRALRSPTARVPVGLSGPSLAVAVGLGVVGGAFTMSVGQDFAEGAWGASAGLLWLGVPGVAVADIGVGRSRRHLTVITAAVTGLVCLGVVVVTLVFVDATASWRSLAVPVVFGLLVVPLVVYSDFRVLESWRSATELDNAQRAAVEMAGHRERMRLAEDLHDILGHSLEVVALKSELALRLREVDPERADAEVAETHRLARAALREVREVARERRRTELAAEIVAVTHLVESAGIQGTTVGFPAVPEPGTPASVILGRVLREATTNLLRHSDATWCGITVRERDGRVELVVRNDGVRATAGETSSGGGLEGLGRRLGELGGRLSAGVREDGVFELAASVPSSASVREVTE
ncbi:two-component sensor histidine kinase [Actinoalloteichus sp. AHMU CJ021]|uniref:sensor histidine kinase n=2 Tax=Pseudonocardiaceae TaxID=2070 RepID=UPI00068EAF08|nr:histidine kinase [Actinoalloteichus caeruleus]AUS79154.1 two-component sensor histidine kinase [Actinoalloteichus sp. AHMU CJ021]